jgi:hypothetical protein
MSLLIALPGPSPDIDAAAAHEALPALPVLTALLARARRLPAASDWRSGVFGALCGTTGGAAIADVAVAARAVPGLAVGAPVCLAAPLHVLAGISRVHLPPGGCLRLDDAEAERWAEAFNCEIGAPDVRLHAVAGGWLLAAPFAVGTGDAAPETLLGEPLQRAPARDVNERALRRLGAEVEIWLTGHPLNRARESRGLPAINSLWFWGGAWTVELPAPARPPRALLVAGQPDPWLAGLAAYCALPLGVAAGWPLAMPSADTLLALVAPPQGLTRTHWQRLEAQWFGPVASALRRGEISALRLQIGASAWRLPDSSPLRWLRRSRPWYRQVQT